MGITSEEFPYQIVDIAHINMNKKGRLTISISPGKKDRRFNRNLELDLEEIRKDGIDIIVCLLEWSEMTMLQISDYHHKVQEYGITFYHLPIKDKGIPQQKELNALIPIIVLFH